MIKPSLIQNDPLIEPTGQILGLTFSGNYSTGGDTLNLTPSNISDPGLQGVLGPNQTPVAVDVLQENLGGYYVEVIPGASLSTWKVQCFQPGGTEVAAGAYPAAFTTGTPVLVKVIFNWADR